MYVVRNRYRALGGRPVTSVANQFAIAARTAAIDQSAHQMKWGIASRRRKKTVRRERRKSSETVTRTKGSATGGLCVEIEARCRFGVLPLQPGERAQWPQLEPPLAGLGPVVVLRLVGVGDRVFELVLLHLAVEDHDLVATVEVDDDPRIARQVKTFARKRARAEVDGAVGPNTPDRRRARLAVRARGDDPVVAGCSEALVGPAPRQHALLVGGDAVLGTELRPTAAHPPDLSSSGRSEKKAAPTRQRERLLKQLLDRVLVGRLLCRLDVRSQLGEEPIGGAEQLGRGLDLSADRQHLADALQAVNRQPAEI